MRRLGLALVVTLPLVLGGILVSACHPNRERASAPRASEAFLEITRGNLTYMYHLATRSESLFDEISDPRRLANIIRERPEQARRLRLTLEDELDVSSLDEINDAKHIEDALRGLGYI